MFDDVKVRRKVDLSQQGIKSLNAKIKIVFTELQKAESVNDLGLVTPLLRQHSDLIKQRYSLIKCMGGM